MMVVLFDALSDSFSVRGEQLRLLAGLGITNVAVLRDSETVGVVVEGWLFDPTASGGAVAPALGARSSVRTLHPVLQMAVSATTEGGRDG